VGQRIERRRGLAGRAEIGNALRFCFDWNRIALYGFGS
jgi:hypothetical protein